MTEVFSRLVFMRHGESLWNKKGLFTGWVDVDLTENGRNETIMGAKELKKTNILFDSMHTSYLKRAIKTGNITLEIIDQLYIPIYQSWRLNERMYGNLQGLNKKDTVKKFGKDQVLKWRRSFDIPPPKIDKNNKYNPKNEKKYKNIGSQNIPETESLKEVIARAQPYFDDVIMKELKNGKNILIAAHGNSIRAIVKYLDKIPNDIIPGLEIPTGIPLLYEFDKNMNIIKAENAIPPLSGKFLGDPERIKKMQDKVKNQIKTDDSKADIPQSIDETPYKPSLNTGIFGKYLSMAKPAETKVDDSETVVDEVLPLALTFSNPYEEELIKTAKTIGTPGKGILAADESTGTIGKRLASIGVKNEEVNRRKYRQLLFTTPDLEKYISGVIMYDETLRQKSDKNIAFVDILKKKGIITGIKTDKGTRALPYKPNEKYTQGLTDLDVRSTEYYKLGARFCKWRAVLVIQNGYISETAIKETAWTLARYAAISQMCGLAPIVEPEILMDGNHSIKVNQYWTEKVITACYKALSDQEVILEGTLLKPNMVLAGKQYKGKIKNTFELNAKSTVTALKRSVPSAVPTINFLSGGQSEEVATRNLNEINKYKNLPWQCSFSYGRALQQSCLKAWKGDDANIEAAQKAFMVRAKANSEAQLGTYKGDAATDDAKASLYEEGYTY